MSDDETMTVRLTLRRPIAERLRAMCKARGETASELVDRWILSHDERGEPLSVARTNFDRLRRIFGG